jgi:hypothetical protein
MVMSETNDPRDDATDDVMLAGGEPGDIASLREAVLRQTVGVVRFRRRMRKCVLGLSLVGCYAAGMATGTWRLPADSAAAPATSASVPGDRAGGGIALAKLSPEESARRDADRQLLDHGDVKEAVLGYDRYLKLASADHRAISAERDSWLLMALKDARLREASHERSAQD